MGGRRQLPQRANHGHASACPQICGKFLYAGAEKLYLRGVTYGTFRPDENGDEYPPADAVERDFDRWDLEVTQRGAT